MTVTERLMGIGQFDVALAEDTPPSLLRDLDDVTPFGHLIVTPAHMPLEATDLTGLLAMARWTGVVRTRPEINLLEGAGLALWLGDEDGKGRILEVPKSKTAGTFSDWINELIPSGLDPGTISAVAGTLTHTFQYVTRRAAIDYVCDFFGAEWRINPDLTLDAGETADLFVTVPTLIVRKGEGGREGGLDGLDGRFGVHVDWEDYTTRVVVLTETGSGAADISPATEFYDLDGSRVVWTRLVESADTEAGNETAVAQAQLNRFTSSRRSVDISTVEYDIGGFAQAGDAIDIFDPERGIYDLSNPVQYRGGVIFPESMRLQSITWPLRAGMGVYAVTSQSTPVVFALSEYVVWESGGQVET